MLTLAIISTVAYYIMLLYIDRKFKEPSTILIYGGVSIAFFVVYLIKAYQFIFWMNVFSLVVGIIGLFIINKYFNNKSKK